MDELNIGDRVRCLYREHSIPTISDGTVVGFEGRGVVIEIDDEIFESGDSVIWIQEDDVVRL